MVDFPEDPILGKTTWNVGKLSGDNPQNILSPEVTFRLYFRTTFATDDLIQHKLEGICPKGSSIEAFGGDRPLEYHHGAPGLTTTTVSFGSDAPRLEKFAQKAADAGIDGLILPDVPYEEKEEFTEVFDRYGLDLISMIVPTSEDRIAMIAKEAKGFIYMVSSLGVTGTRSEITTDISAMTDLVKKNSEVPCAVGFGISTPEQAARMAELSDGAIVGSAIIKIIAKYGKEAAGPVGEYVKEMADAVHAKA